MYFSGERFSFSSSLLFLNIDQPFGSVSIILRTLKKAPVIMLTNYAKGAFEYRAPFRLSDVQQISVKLSGRSSFLSDI